MQIVGLQKTTLVDYPGVVACTLFTPGCNFRCPYCHNPETHQANARLPNHPGRRILAVAFRTEGLAGRGLRDWRRAHSPEGPPKLRQESQGPGFPVQA